jgi:hypothetical protein
VFDDSGIAFPQPMQGDRGAFTPENFLGDYKMKTMKLALLATAALVAVSASARAESGAELNTYMQNLNVAAAADAPAAGSIDWNMEVRATMDYIGESNRYTQTTDTVDGVEVITVGDETVSVDSDFDITARARLSAHGHTETSVGKVGVKIRIQGGSEWGGGASTVMNVGYGYWNMTESATLIAGYTGSLSGIGYGQDATNYGRANGPGSMAGDQEQFQLAFASGPMSFAVAVEDGNDNDTLAGQSDVAFAAEVKYSGDSISGEMSVGYGPNETGDDFWVAGVGMGFALGDMASISVAAQTDSEDDWNASIFASVDVSDAARIEAGVGFADNTELVDSGSTIINVGAYWTPVDQLTMGVQADYKIFEDDNIDSNATASFVTWFRF